MTTYHEREQTAAKHFILKRYLQELSFKVLHGWDLAYVDGFSGPWESKTEDFSDTSFMIALSVLKDAQERTFATTGKRRKIRCFFSEKNREAYKKLNDAVAPYHDPEKGFEVCTFHGAFEDAVLDANRFIDGCFPLIFIDPTGWTGYPFTKIKPLFASRKCEVLINFMYDHVIRFIDHPDDKVVASLDPILGGPGWKARLDPQLKPGLAVEKLFRETLKSAGGFAYVVSTKIDKKTDNRPHFFLAYGTKDRKGLIAFRETEFKALKLHARNRADAKVRKREEQTDAIDMFADAYADHEKKSIETLVEDQKAAAKDLAVELLKAGKVTTFATLVDQLLPAFMLRETNVKDLCVELCRAGAIQQTWGSGNRKPSDVTLIRLA